MGLLARPFIDEGLNAGPDQILLTPSGTQAIDLICRSLLRSDDTVLMDLQVATNFGGSSPVATELNYSVLSSGSYRKHVETLCSRLEILRSDTAAKLLALGISSWLMPRGGCYLWCSLPDGADSADLAKAALTDNMVLAPQVYEILEKALAGL